jgi:hypothetical protein
MNRRIAVFACVLISLVWTAEAAAQVNLGLRGVGVRAGLVDPENVETTYVIGLFTGLGSIHPRLSLESYVNYWEKSRQMSSAGDLSVRDIAIGARVEYSVPMPSSIAAPFVGVGLSIHFLNGTAHGPGYATGSVPAIKAPLVDSDTRLGLDVGGGVRATASSNIDIVGEMMYSFVDEFGFFSLTVGLVYNLAR